MLYPCLLNILKVKNTIILICYALCTYEQDDRPKKIKYWVRISEKY